MGSVHGRVCTQARARVRVQVCGGSFRHTGAPPAKRAGRLLWLRVVSQDGGVATGEKEKKKVKRKGGGGVAAICRD